MNKKTINYLFPGAKVVSQKANKKEVREGWLILDGQQWRIQDGIVYAPKLSREVVRERRAIKIIDEIPHLGGSPQADKKIFFEALEALPESSNSPLFIQPGSFCNISLGASEYFNFLKSLKGNLHILELGADTGWSCVRLAEMGHQVIGLDISDHLKLRDFWLKKVYFEAVQADMNDLPFRENLFDLVFASATIHHSQDLSKVAREIWRVLKPGGRFSFLREPMKGKWAKSNFGKKQKDLGVSENLYSFEQWLEAFRKAGFKNFKIALALLGYRKAKVSLKYKLIFLMKDFKKNLLRNFPFLRDSTVSDYNFSGQKPLK